MTDAATKNLQIENLIASELKSQYKPIHLLCKSHTVETLDRSNLDVLAKIEKQVNQRGSVENINPNLKSFFRGKKTVVESGIEALLALIMHDKSAKSCSQANLFDRIYEKENVVQRIFLYQQRRFAKLGKAAASLLEALTIIKKVPDETYNNNLLIEACRLYIESKLFITELEVLASFNHHVTFSFLNCIENCNQKDLLNILPTLYHAFITNSTGPLSKYKMTMQHTNIEETDSKLSSKILEDFCLAAGEAIKIQCGREYGFANENEKTRATVLLEIRINKLGGLPTNNHIAERDLLKFDRLSKVRKSCNRKFKAKAIRNSMNIINRDNLEVEKIEKKIMLILKYRETNWDGQQKMKLKLRLTKKTENGRKNKGLH